MKRSRFSTACASVTRVFIRFVTPTTRWKPLFIQSHRYIPDRFLPDKAIDVIDEAGARVKLRVRREQGSIDAIGTHR